MKATGSIYIPTAGTWSFYFDGSDVGLTQDFPKRFKAR